MILAKLVTEFGADVSGLSRGFTVAERLAESAAGRFTSVGSALTVGLTLPIVAFGAATVAAAVRVDAALDTIRIGTEKTGEALNRLGNDFRAVAGSIAAPLQSAAEAITALNQRTGQTGAGLQALSGQVLNLRRLTGEDLSGLIEANTRAFADWSIATDKQSSALDNLFKTSQATGAGFTSLAQNIVKFGAPLRQLGFTFEQSAALLGRFEKEGVRTELVFGGLRRALSTFASAGVEAGPALQAVITRIRELGPGAEATALAMKTFGARAGPDLASAILEGRFAIDSLVEQIGASGETINKAAADTIDFGDQLQILRNQATLALEKFATPAMPAFLRWSQQATQLVAGLGSAIGRMSETQRDWTLAIASTLAAAGPVLLTVGALTRAVTALSTALGVAGLVGTITTGGVLLALGGLAALFVKNRVEALAAAGAADRYRASLIGLSGVELGKNLSDLDKRIAQLNARQRELRPPSLDVRPREAPAGVVREFRSNQEEIARLTAQRRDLVAAQERFAASVVSANAAIASAAATTTPGMDSLLERIGSTGEQTRDLASELGLAGRAAREFAVANRLGTTSLDAFSGPLREAFDRSEEVRGRVEALGDALAALGSRAPSGAVQAFRGLAAEAAVAESEVERLVRQMEAAGRLTPSLRLQDTQSGLRPSAAVLDALTPKQKRLNDLTRQYAREWQNAQVAIQDALADGLDRVLQGMQAVHASAARLLSDSIQLVRAFGQLRQASRGGAVTGLPDFGAMIAGAAGVAATFVSIGQQLVSGMMAHSQEIAEASRNNRDALDRLSDRLEGFRVTFGAQTAAADALRSVFASMNREGLSGLFGFQQTLREFGLTMSQVDAIAESLGIQLRDSAGRIILSSLAELQQALSLSALSIRRYSESVEGQRALLDARLEIFDLSDPLSRLQGQFGLLERLAPELLRDFGLANLDLGSAASRAVLEQGLRDMLTALTAGKLDASALAGFESVDEFIRHLTETDRALDAFGETARKAGESLTNAVQGFKIERYRFEAMRGADAPSPFLTPAAPIYSGQPAITVGTISIPVYIEGSGDGTEMYRELYAQMARGASVTPEFRPIFEVFPKP